MKHSPLLAPAMGRRRFVTGLGAGVALAATGFSPLRAAEPGRELRGSEFHLSIGQTPVNFTGRTRQAITVNHQLPAPLLRWREGDQVTLHVTNTLPTDTSIHWHGVLLPTGMDGVPGLSYPGIKPGETFTYRFDVRQSGTYWYHSHSGFQEQVGLYGPIIIDPAEPDPVSFDREHVIQLSDWSDNDPRDIYATLKKVSDYYNFNERTLFDLIRDIRDKGVAQTWHDRRMWNQMRMSDRDLSDVTGYTYTFLMNGQTPADNWKGLFRKGEKVRLRFINSSAMTFFDIRIPGLKMTVVATDGQPVHPVSIEEFRLGVAETVDVIVTPDSDSAYSIFCQALDRSGYACGTLAADTSLSAKVPAMDPVPLLGMREMGMGGMGGMNGMGGMSHDTHSSGESMSGMKMSGMKHTADAMNNDMAGMNHDSGKMNSNMPGMTNDKTGTSHDMSMKNAPPDPDLAPRSSPADHVATEYGPGVDMRAAMPARMLDDPGVGLRNNGRRVLTYSDLSYLHGLPDSNHADREITLHLTGSMSRYIWSFNGIKFADAMPLALKYGERARINLVNDTMMHHPIHLHGMWSDIEISDNQLLRKHTVVVKPGEIISYLVRADAKGRWAYHCHLLYHMEAGMFREVRVS